MSIRSRKPDDTEAFNRNHRKAYGKKTTKRPGKTTYVFKDGKVQERAAAK